MRLRVDEHGDALSTVGSANLPILLVLAFLAILIALWAAGPSALDEIHALRLGYRRDDPWKLDIWRQGRRIEFQIGPGAHTHYWDHTAPIIGREVDDLIATI